MSLDYWILTGASFIALTLSFGVANVGFEYSTKLIIFLIVTVIYAGFAAVFYLFRRKKIRELQTITESFKFLEKNVLIDENSAQFQVLESLKANFAENSNHFLPDLIENLPNERDFLLILENQVAESQRYQDERHLSVLSIGIIDFNILCEKYGPATCDQAVAFVGAQIKEELREMDFLTRAQNDEFLSVLPTLDEKSTAFVVKRIEKAVHSKPFIISNRERIYLNLNFGSATFGKEGETAQELLNIARFKRDEAKLSIKGTILHFPKQYLN